ncbi:hypothetical protein [Micromonospora sp. NPDC048887]|uniref:hypothetical protein n=1 Tax=Micromonospora sp. NPDC048887 TaxID=3155614 RepID=UPI0033D1702E
MDVMVDQGFSSLVQRLYDIDMALAALGKLSTAAHDDESALDYADGLGWEVLTRSATHVSAILSTKVTAEQLAQIAASGATDILTAALTRERPRTRKAFEKAIVVSSPSHTNRPQDLQRGAIAGIALAIGVGVLAATTGAPLAALAVGESVAKEIIKAAITGAVSGLVTESATRLVTRSTPQPEGDPPMGGLPLINTPLTQAPQDQDKIAHRLEQLAPMTEQPPAQGDHTSSRTGHDGFSH